MLVYTSITKSYLPKARVLAKSLKRFHPDWTFVLLYSDDFPVGFDIEKEPFDEILTIDQLGISNWKSWAFGHAVVELCTAVKGPAAELLARRPNVDKIMYIDPDIKVFNSLAPLEAQLNQCEILLTPHLLDAENSVEAIKANEITALKYGVYNLGFFAARTSGQGLDFIRWWAERLTLFCRDDIPSGLFTDQRWCDLAPAFFSGLGIVRDRGCNVATWNIGHRRISKDSAGMYFAGDVPLRFYHFTGYDSGAGINTLERYASEQTLAHELWDVYGKDIIAEGHGDVRYCGWRYGQFENGESIPKQARRLYIVRPDLLKAFRDPYSVVEPCFLSWWNAEFPQERPVEVNIESNSTRTVTGRLLQGFNSPRDGIQIVKSVIRILKYEGISGLIQRIRRYSL
ncbi:glycosyl transferase [Rhodoferax sp. 4810]|nr:glycosyl transferase [Rhodoferax jenense]